jgi:hypothetical protein
MKNLKHVASFGFQTRYFNDFYKKDLGALVITGKCEYREFNHEDDDWNGRDGFDPESVFSFDIEQILWENENITKMYHTGNMLDGSLEDVINKSTLQHLEWVFKAEIAAHFGEVLEQDTNPNDRYESELQFPTAEEIMGAIDTITRSYKVPSPAKDA